MSKDESNEFGKLIKGKELETLVSSGGCPANNTKCFYLNDGICSKANPEIYFHEDGKIACASMS